MNQSEFVAALGGVYEHSAWVAEQAYTSVVHPLSLAKTQRAMREVVARAPREKQLALLRAHPDLAGRAALAGELTAASAAEQAGSGLDTLDARELERFTSLNRAYTEKFGFPFIMAVKGASKHQILAGFESRIPNTEEIEFDNALENVHRIAGFRLTAWFEESAE